MAKIGLGGQLLNALRNVTLSSQEKRDREGARVALALVQLAAVVATAVAGVFLLASPGIFTSIGFASTALFSFDSYMIANNLIEVLDHASVEWGTITTEEEISQAAKNTLIVNPIIRILIAFRTNRY